MSWKSWIVGSLICSATALFADEPTGELAQKLASAEVTHYAEAPGYSEGPVWRNGELYFCSAEMLRVSVDRKVSRYLEVNPAGLFLRENGDILVADNKYHAILNVTAAGDVEVIADQFEGQPLRSLNDLTADANGNIYWSDPAGSTVDKPTGNIFRVDPTGQVLKVATGLAFPNGLDVDPRGENLYVIESQTQKILRYSLAGQPATLPEPATVHNLGGSGGDGCAFDAEGNLWVADFHRKETGKGRITVVAADGQVLGHLNVPSKVVSNLTFGGPDHDEIFCTTGEPPGVFHAKVKVKGFRGHPAKQARALRRLELKAMRQQ